MVNITFGNSAIDIQLHDKYFVFGISYFIFLLAFFIGLLAILYYSIPKLIKKSLNKVLSYLHFIITSGGVATILATCYFLSIARPPRRYYNFEGHDSFSQFQSINKFFLLVWTIFFIAQLIFVINIVYSKLKGPKITSNFNEEYL